VPVAGAAALQVVINAPALGQDSHGYVGKVLAGPRADFYTPTQLARLEQPSGDPLRRLLRGPDPKGTQTQTWPLSCRFT
jgi:hypothetical protein